MICVWLLKLEFLEVLKFYVQWDYLDNPHKPKTRKVFREKLSIELLFSLPDDKVEIPRFIKVYIFMTPSC
ncbi:hypothetical protein CEXT_462061 [Caerostris extrusa]|uniref:Uncharacterized protein n=1 Tax=Caerostris extrusa TaxID=172846 RepID=A0AAV4SM17_CAEEX|nr:hypothetical protein CEXT_462061 [Caerostris extrusa]